MKQQLATIPSQSEEREGFPAKPQIEITESDAQNFAHGLRALGQALEKFSFSAFDLELRSGTYLVKGTANSTDKHKFSFPKFVRTLLHGSHPEATLTCNANQVDLRFSQQDIDHFELRGKTKRQDARGMPDPYSVSQILRGAGAYLDNRDVTKLVGISLKGKWVTVSYQTVAGRLEAAQQDLEYFYDYWVKMYLRRSNRLKPLPSSKPTLIVTWEGPRPVLRAPA